MFEYLAQPVPVAELTEWIPHRGSAVWITEVVACGPREGRCRIELDPSALYCDEGKIRATSVIEWIAQSFGYSCVCFAAKNKDSQIQVLKKAFLVGIRGFTLTEDFWKNREVKKGSHLFVDVRQLHELGPLAIVEGKVFFEKENLLGRAELKLFAAPEETPL